MSTDLYHRPIKTWEMAYLPAFLPSGIVRDTAETFYRWCKLWLATLYSLFYPNNTKKLRAMKFYCEFISFMVRELISRTEPQDWFVESESRASWSTSTRLSCRPVLDCRNRSLRNAPTMRTEAMGRSAFELQWTRPRLSTQRDENMSVRQCWCLKCTLVARLRRWRRTERVRELRGRRNQHFQYVSCRQSGRHPLRVVQSMATWLLVLDLGRVQWFVRFGARCLTGVRLLDRQCPKLSIRMRIRPDADVSCRSRHWRVEQWQLPSSRRLCKHSMTMKHSKLLIQSVKLQMHSPAVYSSLSSHNSPEQSWRCQNSNTHWSHRRPSPFQVFAWSRNDKWQCLCPVRKTDDSIFRGSYARCRLELDSSCEKYFNERSQAPSTKQLILLNVETHYDQVGYIWISTA